MAYRRDASKVMAILQETASDQLITTQPCKIQVPTRFVDAGLAQVGIDTYIYAVYALIMEDGTYMVSNVNTMMKIEPSKTIEVKINDVPYYEFYFEAGSVICHNVNLVKRDILIYNLLDELVFKGKVPWYMGYDDMGKLLDTSASHAGSYVNANLEIIELFMSMISRDPNDLTKYYRTIIRDRKFVETTPSKFIPLKSVFYAATNTLNKLAGSYFNDGVVSALVNPTQHVERIEELLRK